MAEDESLRWWYEYHREDYETVKERLSYARNVMLQGRMDSATDMLRKSSVFAVLSIQTPLDRAERAFMAWDTGTRLDEAAYTTTYGGRKADWLSESLANHDFEATVKILRDHGPNQALKHLVDGFKGLAERKAAFALALLGVWELMCIDTNVEQFTDVEVPRKFRGHTEKYMATCDDIMAAEHKVFRDVEPFIFQWAVFDYRRGEHRRHMMFYTSILPALESN